MPFGGKGGSVCNGSQWETEYFGATGIFLGELDTKENKKKQKQPETCGPYWREGNSPRQSGSKKELLSLDDVPITCREYRHASLP